MGDKKLTHIKGWLVRHSDGLNLVLELKVVCVLSLVSIKAGIDQCMGNYPISSLNLLIGSCSASTETYLKHTKYTT